MGREGTNESLNNMTTGMAHDAPSCADWNKNAAAFDAFTMLELDDTAHYLDVVGLRDSDTLLDVCCGSGRVALEAAKRCRFAMGFDSSEAMVDLAKKHAQDMGLTNTSFSLRDWDYVLPNQNIDRYDVVFASRCNAMVEVEKLSLLARRTVVAQFFADAPPIPYLQEVLLSGCGEPSRSPKPPRLDGKMWVSHATSIAPITFIDLIGIVRERGYFPNLRILPERFHAVFESVDDAVAFACSLRPERTTGYEDRVRENMKPFLREVEQGVEFRMETRASLVWWDVNLNDYLWR